MPPHFIFTIDYFMLSCYHVYMTIKKGAAHMAATKAHLDGNARHMAKLERIVIQPYKEEAQAIRAAAQAAGQTMTQYILQAIRQRMESESK